MLCSIFWEHLLNFPLRNSLNPVLVELTGCHALSRSRRKYLTQGKTVSEFSPEIGIWTLLLQRLSVNSCSLGSLCHQGTVLPELGNSPFPLILCSFYSVSISCLFAAQRTATCHALLSSTISWSLLKRMSIAQDWSPLGWTGWISLQSKGLSRVFSNTTVQKHQFFGAQLSL